MKLRLYRSYWGATPAYADYAAEAQADGYDGLEAAVPLDRAARHQLQAALTAFGFDLIAEICTAGSYVPDRQATPQQHLDDLARKLDAALLLAPRHINCIAGCDAWPVGQSLDFFGRAIALAQQAGVSLSFETHRSRSLFTPWITRELVAALPALTLTADFSHWCVVCERLMDSELDTLDAIAPRVRHLHARVGYDQGPQVPHPAAPEHAGALAAHQRWWALCWEALRASGCTEATMTPEFGPDGYLHRLPFTDQPVADLREINRWMLRTERAHFAMWRRSC